MVSRDKNVIRWEAMINNALKVSFGPQAKAPSQHFLIAISHPLHFSSNKYDSRLSSVTIAHCLET